MANEDLYGVLGVSRGADEKEIKKAYRRLARELHPDHTKGDKAAEERFKKVSAAYAVLGDREKRKLYDQYGIDGLRDGFDPEMWRRYGGGFGGRPGTGARPQGVEFDFGGFSGFGSLEDVFESLFGGSGFGRRGAVRGRGASPFDIRAPGAQVQSVIEVDLLDAVLGRELQIAVPIGPEQRKLKVKVPRGIEDGQSMRLKGQGAKSPEGGPAGDLLLEIRIRDHPRYRRTGMDLEVREVITVGQAYRGTSLPVETPWGKVKVTVPAGTQGGQRLRVKGHGVRKGRGGESGDLYVQLSIRIPTQQGPEVEEAIEKLEQMY